MDLNRLQKLAGLPLTEAVKLDEAAFSKIEIHSSKPGPGQLGNIIVMEGGKELEDLAKLLGVPDGWKKTKIKDGVWSAYDGERLSFFNKEDDFQPEDEEFDE